MVKKWDFEIQAAAEALLLQVTTFGWFYLCGIGRILSWHNSMRDFAIGFAVLFWAGGGKKASSVKSMGSCRMYIPAHDGGLSLCHRNFPAWMACGF